MGIQGRTKWLCGYCSTDGIQSNRNTALFMVMSHIIEKHMPITWLHYGVNEDDDLYSGVIAPYVFAEHHGDDAA